MRTRTLYGLFVIDLRDDSVGVAENKKGKWGPWKGVSEDKDGNNGRQTALREVMEESGIQAKDLLISTKSISMGPNYTCWIASFIGDQDFVPVCNDGELSRTFWHPIKDFLVDKRKLCLDERNIVHKKMNERTRVGFKRAWIAISKPDIELLPADEWVEMGNIVEEENVEPKIFTDGRINI